ncbi:MAG: alanine--glyoxylate aminotransferase family protein [Proteobacteria bacterium]|nr:alanine--glyoxylate aminotransferase family protein [Pseudomonadota bacterium]
MAKQYLLTPGPTPVPERAALKMAEPIIHHRTPEFEAIVAKVREQLRWLFQTKEEVIIFASSGTGAMEASVSNLLSSGDKALVIKGGKFGERWAEILKAYKIETIEIPVEWGKALDVKKVEEALAAHPEIRAVYVQASETSTGIKYPIRELAALIGPRENTLLVVDAITALGVFPLPMDEWKIDVLVTGSQKALMLPPGLSFAALSQKAWKFAEKSNLPRYYFNFKKELKNLQKNQNAFTPAVTLIIGLHEVLSMMQEEGLEKIFERNARMARATRESMLTLGLSLFAPDSPSDAVTAVLVPSGMDAGKIIKHVWEKQGIKIADGQDQAKGKIFRIAHMGYIHEPDLLIGIAAIEMALKDLGHPVELGKGVGKALEVMKK